MSETLRLRLDCELYDEQAIRDTADEFRSVARITVRRAGGGLTVSLTTDHDDPDRVAGELLNLALARTLEARSTPET
jgi:hypothetical protein